MANEDHTLDPGFETKSFTFNVDFDGTCVTHDFPRVGREIGAVPVLKELVAVGHRLILFTMRSDKGEGEMYLSDAVAWFKRHDIPLFGIQTHPTQSDWTASPKSYANFMIDDSSVCAPLRHDRSLSNRPFIDWDAIRSLLVDRGLLPVVHLEQAS